MKKRIIFGAVMIAGVAGLLWADWLLARAAGEGASLLGLPLKGLPLAGAIVVLTAWAFAEFSRLAAAAGVRLLGLAGLFAAAALATLPFWWQGIEPAGPGAKELLVLAGLGLGIIFAEQMARYRTADAMRQIGCTLLAVLYLGVGGALMLSLRLAHGTAVLVLFLAAVKFTDIGAYFTGRAAGRHKMVPWLSPGKSWEGLAGGLAAGAGVSILAARLLGIGNLAVWEAAAFGVAVGAAGQFADMCESLMKRSARMKDSGAAVPEFGGVLDIIDSPLLAAPVAMILLEIMLLTPA